MASDKIKGITVDLDINNNKLVRKLNAISKHTAALADELEQINKAVCKKCGSTEVNYDRVVATDGPFIHYHCVWCGHKWND